MEEKDYEENVQKKGQPKLKELNTVGERDIRRYQNYFLNRKKGEEASSWPQLGEDGK